MRGNQALITRFEKILIDISSFLFLGGTLSTGLYSLENFYAAYTSEVLTVLSFMSLIFIAIE